MILTPTIVTARTVEPVSLTTIKEHLRVTHDEEDITLALYRGAAIEYVEQHAQLTLMETEYDVSLEAFPAGAWIELPRANPLTSATWIKYKDSAGTTTTLSTSLYVVDTMAKPGRVVPAYGEDWPSFEPWPTSPITIRYKAGIATASPQTYPSDGLIYPVLLLVAGMYENRESETVTDKASVEAIAMKYGVDAYLRMKRRTHAF